METVSFRAGELMKRVRISVRVTGTRRASFRLWLMGRLFWLAALVGGVVVNVETDVHG